jgi:hypothetical protein
LAPQLLFAERVPPKISHVFDSIETYEPARRAGSPFW